jgi:guanylate kinase
VITGCSGVGKGTLINMLIDRNPQLFELSISYTTRRPRQGEVHGREYYFVTKEEFEKVFLRVLRKSRREYSLSTVKYTETTTAPTRES